MNLQKILKKSTFTPKVAVPGLVVLLALSLACAVMPDTMDTILSAIQKEIYRSFSWTYILLVSFFLIFLLFLAFTRIGNIKLGADNSAPQYSFVSWIAMLFSAGMGIGLMYFGVAEPMAHYVNPALPDTLNPAKEAQLATFFHWGLHAWSVFAVTGLILAYFSFRYRLPLAVRSGLYPILGDRIYGPIGDVVDVFALVSTFFGIATSLGFGVMQLSAGLVHTGLLPSAGYGMQCAIIIIVSIVSIFSAVAGVSKGVKMLSEINLGMAVLLMLFVLALGPTVFILSAFSEGIGYYINQFTDLTFKTFAFERDGRAWFTSWTVMYWAWWISWAPFVGLFIARISKGRTIREYIIAVLLVPSLFIFLWMTVFGNGAIWLDQHDAHGALSAVADNPDVLLFTFFEQFPMSTVLSVLALCMIAVFFITSANSGILVMNSISTSNRQGTPNWQKAFWGVLLAGVAMLLLRTGGLQSLQTMTLISALPFGIIMVVLCVCLWMALRTDQIYHGTPLPYGSESWTGRHWRERLAQIITFSQRQDVHHFIENRVRPAMTAVKDELSASGITAEIVDGNNGPLSIELLIRHDRIWNFRYGVRAELQRISAYLMEEDNAPVVEDGKKHYIPVTYYSDGRTGNDIQYLSSEEIIADILREYERYISMVANEENSMIFVDKKNQKTGKQ